MTRRAEAATQLVPRLVPRPVVEWLRRHVPPGFTKFVSDTLQLRRDLPAVIAGSWRLRNDPSFDLANVDRGIAPRPSAAPADASQRRAIAGRVMAAYTSAAAEARRRSPLYRVSNEWVPIFEKPLRPLLDALRAQDTAQLQSLMDGFFRSPISTGLCGLATDMESAFFRQPPSRYRRRQLLVDALHRLRLLQELMPGVEASALAVPDVGNPYGVFLDGAFVRTGADYQYYYASQVARLLDGVAERASVVELGGGIGGFAYFLKTLRPAPTSYINFDLPEILCISSWQLLNLFPEQRFLLHGEGEASRAADYDFALLPSFEIEALSADSVDVCFNSYSLAEMAPESIDNYVRHLGRITREAILHVNHVRHALMNADEFAFDAAKFRLASRTPARWNLGRFLHSDEYEFRLERVGGAGTRAPTS